MERINTEEKTKILHNWLGNKSEQSKEKDEIKVSSDKRKSIIANNITLSKVGRKLKGINKDSLTTGKDLASLKHFSKKSETIEHPRDPNEYNKIIGDKNVSVQNDKPEPYEFTS